MSSSFLTVNEVADYLGISSKWVYSHKRQLPGYIQIAGVIRFDRDLLVSGLKEMAAKPTHAKIRNSASFSDRHGLMK